MHVKSTAYANKRQQIMQFFIQAIVAIGNPERHVHKASHHGSKQQQRSLDEITLLLLVRATIICYCYSHTSRCGASHIQRNATGVVSTTSPPFYNEPHRLHVLFVKASHSMTSTSWLQHHFVAIGNPERHMRKASYCGSKQQQSSHAMITLLLLVRHMYVWCCSSPTSRSW